MDDIKKISELARAGEVSNGDILLISKRTSSSALRSLGLDYANLVNSLRKSFKDEFDTLNTISDTYVDDTTMEFTYDTTKHDLVLKTDASERRINISKFIFTGMVKNVVYKKDSHSLVITFNKADGSTVTIDVDISDVFIFNGGSGINISEDKTISIDPDVVSMIGHKHVLSDITDYSAPVIPTKVSELTNDTGYITNNDLPGPITIDDTLSDTSENPVQNKVVKTYVDLQTGTTNTTIANHVANVKNPHGVTATQVGAVPVSRKVNGKALSSDIALVASDVGALASTVTHLEGDVPVSRKVNGKALSSDIALVASDVGAYSKDEAYSKTETYSKAEVDQMIPSKTSQLTNDSGFLTTHQSLDECVKTNEKVTITLENESGEKVTYELYGKVVS